MSPAVMLATTLLVPAAVAALVYLAGRRLLRRIGRNGDGIIVPVALAAAYAAGHACTAPPAFPPIEVTDRIVWLALALLVSGVIAAATTRAWVRWASCVGLAAVVVAVMIGPIFEPTRQTWLGAGWIAGLTLLFVAAWINLDQLSRRLDMATLGAPLVAIAFGAAVALGASGSIVLGELVAAFAAALATVAVLARSSRSHGGLAAACCAIPGALLIEGYAYVESGLPALSAVLLVAAPLAIWTVRAPALSRRPTWLAALVVAAATTVPVVCAIAAVLAGAPAGGEETWNGTGTWKSSGASAKLAGVAPVLSAYPSRNPR